MYLLREGVPHLCAAQRVQVVHHARAVLRRTQGAEVREVEHHLGRRLGVGRQLEHDADAVEDELLTGGGDLMGRSDKRDRAGRHRASEAAIDLAERTARGGCRTCSRRDAAWPARR